MTKPFSHLRVLELGRMYSAPWAGQLFADFGAQVIKLEAAGGDSTRHGGGVKVKDPQGGEVDGATFISLNRGKKSVVVDLKTPEGQDLVRRLAAASDVLIENFKAGDMERLGLGYQTIRALNPRIIYLSLSGFGQDGPYARRPAMDTLVQAMSGYLALTMEADDVPSPSPMVMNDFASGMYAFSGIMTALYHRDAGGGGGQYIDLSLLEAGIAMMSFRLQAAILSDHSLPKNRGSTRFAPSGLYDAADGKFQISIGPQIDFVRFCTAIRRPDLPDDPRFADQFLRVANKGELDESVIPTLREQTLQVWLDRFAEANIMFSPIYNFKQMMDDPHVRARDLFITVPHAAGGEVPLIRNPLRMSETPVEDYVSPPLLGQHTDEVLADVLGLAAPRLAELRAAGVIGGEAATGKATPAGG